MSTRQHHHHHCRRRRPSLIQKLLPLFLECQKLSTPPRPRLPIRVRGSKEIDNSNASTSVHSIRSVPRKPVLAAYVGRLHQDTTEDREEVLTNYLLAEGLKGVVCKKLKAKDGKTYKTSAFYVTCCTESADLLQ